MNKLICSIAFLLSFLPAAAQLRVAQTATAYGVAGTPMSAALPASAAQGDLLVALIGYYTGATITPPFGWTALSLPSAASQSTTGVLAYYHVVAAGESNSFVFAQNNNSTITIYDVAGADIYNPFNNATAIVVNPSNTAVVTPPVVPTVLGTLPIAALAGERSLPIATTLPGWTFTAPASPLHPLGAAYGPLTTSTTGAVDSQFTLFSLDGSTLDTATLLVNPAGTTGHTPTANPGGPYTGVTNFGVDVDGSASTDPRLESLTYSWNFGDGTTGAGVHPSHIYAKTGNYTLALTVTDVDGNFANASTTVTVAQDCSGVTLGNFGALNNFVPSPSDAWHQDISGAPVDPMSQTILVSNRNDLAGSYLHPDFGGNGAYGIPYTVVDSSITPSVPVNIQAYASESDVAVYPIPDNMPVEGSPADCSGTGDNHAIVFDKHTCAVHEMYHAQSCSTAPTKWSADAGTIWDLTKNEKRPYGITSVDAAGLSVFEGLVRYDEILAGSINHAIRFTANFTKNNGNDGYFAGAATHAAGTLWGTDNIEGMRIRLKAGYDLSSLSPQAAVIAAAMKKYGMILADNGANLYFQGTPDPRWNDDDLDGLKSIPASAFEVVNQSLSSSYNPGAAPLYPNGPIYDSVNHPTGAAPTINSFAPSSTTVVLGQSVTLTADVSNVSYSYIDKAGLVRGPVTVTPTQTTTYTLTSRNSFGTTTATTTVTVQAAVAPSLTFAPVAEKTFGAAPFQVAATSNSTGTLTYTVLSGSAMLSGTTVTLTGIGPVTLEASQVAAGNYTAAAAQVSFNVDPAVPTLAFVPVPSQTLGAAPFTISAISNSPGAITYNVLSGPASVFGGTVALTGTGTVIVQASQSASGNYAAASTTTSFVVNPPVTVVTATVSLQFASSSAVFSSAMSFNVHVALSNSAIPLGTVQIFDGSSIVATYPLTSSNRGTFQGTLLGLLPGQQTMTAVYTPTNHSNPPAKSQPVIIIVGPKPIRVCTTCGPQLPPKK